MNLGDGHLVDTAAGEIELAVGRCHHVPDHAAAGRDVGTGKGFGFRIELHQRVRNDSRLAVPDFAIACDRNAVGLGSCAARRRPLRGNSLIWPVFGSSRPKLFAICPVYQREPSGASAGSCGRELGVGRSNSLMETLAVLAASKSAPATTNKKDAAYLQSLIETSSFCCACRTVEKILKDRFEIGTT